MTVIKNAQSILNTISTKISKSYDVKIIAYPDQSKSGYINMEKIIATHQGQGTGTKALKAFANACEKEGFKGILISAHPLNGFKTTTAEDVDRLIRWYENNGFILTRSSPIPQMELRF